MQPERKKQRKEKYGVSAESATHRNWSDLADLALDSILHRLQTIPDVLSFSFVCSSWRSLYTVSHLNSLPPLLLEPQLSPTLHPQWSHPPCYRLKALSLQTRIPRSPVPSETLTLPCLGYSRGHLVFVSPPNLLLLNVFTGQQTRVPSPPVNSLRPRLVLLTNTDLILACKSHILSYRPRTDTWSQLEDIYATSLLEFQGELLCLHTMVSQGYAVDIQLGALELTGTSISFREKKMNLDLLPYHRALGPNEICRRFGLQLVVCGQELFLLRFVFLLKIIGKQTMDIFKLDFDKSTWVTVRSIGDWCLFVDSVGSYVRGCSEPARWGGRSNCAYITRPQYDGLVVVPLDDNHILDVEEGGPSIRYQNKRLPRWPSPVWVHPGTVLSQKVKE